MNKLTLLLGVMLIPAFAAPAMAQAYDHPQQPAPAQFHRDIAQFHRDENNNNPPAVRSQTQVKLFRVRDDNDNDHGPGKDRHDNDRHDNQDNDARDRNNNDRHDNGPHDNNRHESRDWNRDHPRATTNNTNNNTRVIIKNNNHPQTINRWRGWSHDRDIRNFRDHDYASWRGGHWKHGRHNGRDGWWWTVGTLLYFYSQPVYPYPDPYAPPVVIESTSYAPGYWYYCADPSGYYPYVDSCYVPWRAVPQ